MLSVLFILQMETYLSHEIPPPPCYCINRVQIHWAGVLILGFLWKVITCCILVIKQHCKYVHLHFASVHHLT